MISVRNTPVQLARLTDTQITTKARAAVGNVVTDSFAAGAAYSIAGLGAWNVWTQLATSGSVMTALAWGAAVALGLAGGVMLTRSAMASGQANVARVKEPLDFSIVDQANVNGQVSVTLIGASVLPAVSLPGDGALVSVAIAALSTISALTATVPGYFFLRKAMIAERNEARKELLAPYKAS